MDFNQILGALGNMAPQDPAQPNPATTAAMARSRDTISKILERELGRQNDPFAGLNDVATAATAALASRGKTPFGQALEASELGRAQKTAQIANTLGTLATKEAALTGRGGMTPYQQAQLTMQQMRFLAQRGDKDADRYIKRIDQVRQNLEPEDAVGFMVDVNNDLHEAQRQNGGRALTPEQADAIINRRVSTGSYRTKQVGVQIQPDGFGGFFRTDNRAGTAVPIQPGAPAPATPRAGTPRSRMFDPLPERPDGAPPPTPEMPAPRGVPQLSPKAPGAAERRQGIPAQQPAGPQVDGRLTPSQQGQQAVKNMERQKSASAFSAVADYTLRDAETAGSGAMGPLGWMSRMGGAAVEQIGAAGFGQDYQRLQAEYAPFLGRIVQQGAQSAGIKAGILSIAYLYSKAMDEQGVVGKHDLESALALLGEAQGSVEQLRAALDVLKRNVAAKNGMAAPAPSAPASAPPQAGKVEVGQDGFAYRFKGGNPADPASWELIR